MMGVSALIPVRAGSVRVKNKNIKLFANTSLLAIKIVQMLRIKEYGYIDEIIVNSDSVPMLELAHKFGVKAIQRESYYASSEVPANVLYENLASCVQCDNVLIAHVTSPLLSDVSVLACIKIFHQGVYDSVVSASLVKHFLWQDNTPLNYNPESKPRSQDLPNIFALNHALHILPTSLMYEKKDIVGYKPYFYVLADKEGIDIDNELDFEIAEFLYQKYHLGGG